jgi:hypothetical protein
VTLPTLNVTTTVSRSGFGTWQSSLSGYAPFDVDVRADVGGGAVGTMNYTFYCDSTDLSTAVVPGYDDKFDGVNNNPQISLNKCKYNVPGTYYPKVIVERDGASPTASRATVTVSTAPTLTCSPLGVTTLQVGDTQAFQAVGGIGTFSWDAPTGIPAAQATSAVDTFDTKYDTVGPKAVSVSSGFQTNSCNVDSVATCSFTSSRKVIYIPPLATTTLTWSCDSPTICTVDNDVTSSTWSGSESGSGDDQPAVTTNYTLNCFNSTLQATTTVRVFDINKREEVLPR